jgi:hypothetical protein
MGVGEIADSDSADMSLYRHHVRTLISPNADSRT